MRDSVAKFIAKRDGHLLPPDVSNIICADGASQAVHLCKIKQDKNMSEFLITLIIK